MNQANNAASALRCKVGDRVMFVGGRCAELLGRIAIVRCATGDAIESTRPDELAQVLRRDWVVELEGAPSTCTRDGITFATHSIAATDRILMPLRQDLVEVESEEEAAA